MELELRPIDAVPTAKRQKKGSMYDAILNQFLKSNENASEVIIKGDTKPTSVATGLKNRISANKEFSGIAVSTRKIEGKIRIYLRKT
jgi:DNA-binding protein